ncbi:MAG: o-succinylbenzoate synthase [Myxococcota bacterium]|nr:o-succinylbenzoate synthase [Myxococcota bacterium]
MKVVSLRCAPFRIPLRRPLATARGLIKQREGWLVELRDAEGRCGFGEAAPLPGFGFESLAELRRSLGEAAAPLCGAEIEGPADGRARIASAVANAPGARAALDCALHDLAARVRGTSLAAWLASGGALRDPVATSALVAASLPDAAADEARTKVAAGHRTLKLKVGGGRDLARVAAVRDAVGAEIALRVDANGVWSERDAPRALERLALHAPAFVEEPLASRDPAAWARLRAVSPVPIAADESAPDVASARALLDAGAADWIVLKPAAQGGLAAAWEIAALARAADAGVVVTSFLDTAIGRASALHLAAALPGRVADAGLATGALLASDLAELADAAAMPLPDAAGLGVVPDPACFTRDLESAA